MVYFQGKNIPTGVSAGIAYYVINTNTTVWSFQVSASAGGSALTLGSTGTESYVYSPTHAINWLVPSMPVTGSDGAWTAYVQVTAGSGKTNQTNRNFTYTTTPPSLTYTNISASGGTVISSTTPSLTGNLTDVSGVASASYALQVWDPAAGTWNSSSKTWTSSGTWNTVSSGI